jgi:hypothetical protein
LLILYDVEVAPSGNLLLTVSATGCNQDARGSEANTEWGEKEERAKGEEENIPKRIFPVSFVSFRLV